jgi:hypothetical protein
MKRKHLTKTPVCPQERLVIISNTTGLSFTLESIGPLAAIIITIFYLLVLYLSALSNTPKNPFASIYSDFLIETACQHLLLVVGFDTLIYRKYNDTPLYLWVISHRASLAEEECREEALGASDPLHAPPPGASPEHSAVARTRLAWLAHLSALFDMWLPLSVRGAHNPGRDLAFSVCQTHQRFKLDQD